MFGRIHRVLGVLPRIALMLGFLLGVLAPMKGSAREAENEVVEECGERAVEECSHVRAQARMQSTRAAFGGPSSRLARGRAPGRIHAPPARPWVRVRVELPRRIPPPDEDPLG